MNNAIIFMILRPDAKFEGNEVNFFSLETIAKTYIGADLPTQKEMDAKAAALAVSGVEDKRLADIKNAADAYVLSVYDDLEQRKLLSISADCTDQLNLGLITQAEYAGLIELIPVREANVWIKSVRDIETAAKAAGTLPENIVWPAKPT